MVRLGDWQALENVVRTVVTVPELLTPTVEAYRHLNTLPYLDRVAVDGEGELIGEAITGIFHVGGLQIREAAPVVGGVAHVN